jgi:predicted amidohydrolase
MRLAAYQGRCVQGDPTANVASVIRVMEQAAAQQIDLLCFPEAFLSGYGDRATVERGALRLDDPHLTALAQATGRHDLVVIAGFSERRRDRRLASSAVILYRGRVLGLYRKTVLSGADVRAMGFVAGRVRPVFRAKGLTFGCVICSDSSHVEPAATLAHKGARVLFSLHYNRIGRRGLSRHVGRIRAQHAGLAALLGIYVVRANVVVDDRADGLACGDSAIFDPHGQIVAEGGLFREALIMADAHLPLDAVETRRRRPAQLLPAVSC